jgi:hypothetical protein
MLQLENSIVINMIIILGSAHPLENFQTQHFGKRISYFFMYHRGNFSTQLGPLIPELRGQIKTFNVCI